MPPAGLHTLDVSASSYKKVEGFADRLEERKDELVRFVAQHPNHFTFDKLHPRVHAKMQVYKDRLVVSGTETLCIPLQLRT